MIPANYRPGPPRLEADCGLTVPRRPEWTTYNPDGLGIWSLESLDFSTIIYSHSRPQGPVWLDVIPMFITILVSRSLLTLLCRVERRALQSITCNVHTSRRPIFAQQHFHSTQRRSVIYLPRPNNAGTLMRLDLVYFLALFVLLVPSVAKTHQSISHKFMAFGDKVSAINPCLSLGIFSRY